MTDAEMAAAIHDACKSGATVSDIKCFVEGMRRDTILACAKLCERSGERCRDGGNYDWYDGYNAACEELSSKIMNQHNETVKKGK